MQSEPTTASSKHVALLLGAILLVVLVWLPGMPWSRAGGGPETSEAGGLAQIPEEDLSRPVRPMDISTGRSGLVGGRMMPVQSAGTGLTGRSGDRQPTAAGGTDTTAAAPPAGTAEQQQLQAQLQEAIDDREEAEDQADALELQAETRVREAAEAADEMEERAEEAHRAIAASTDDPAVLARAEEAEMQVRQQAARLRAQAAEARQQALAQAQQIRAMAAQHEQQARQRAEAAGQPAAPPARPGG